ncbi:ermin-like isoform X2 [Narcine bancroftii]|uniref:ermin-like isoform X2 n=1 Tax=Narcine bancroftii TaxID=1343680 RepID=UPI003831E429
MAEQNSCSVETDKTIMSVHQPEVVDIEAVTRDNVPLMEEKILTGVGGNFLSPEDVTSSEGPKSIREESNSPSREIITSGKTITSTEESIPCTGETISQSEENSSTLEIIPRTEESRSAIKQVILTAKETCLSSELALPSVQQIHSTADETMSFHNQTNVPREQTVVTPQKTIISTEKIHQPSEETILATENVTSFTSGTVIPEVISIQSLGPEFEIISSSSMIEEEIIPQSSPLENSTDGELSEAEQGILLPPEAAFEKEGEADRNVRNNRTNKNDDDMEADEEIYLEEFQQRNDLEPPSTSPLLSCQPESPTNTECAEEQLRSSKRSEITKHSYSRYNTVSYRKIKKGITKQRIDEFESMLQTN